MNSKNTISNKSLSTEQSFLAIALKKLTRRELQVLILLSSAETKKNATQSVKAIVSSLHYANSSAWSILKSLREMRLIEYNKGSYLELSSSAEVLVKEISK